MRSNRRYAGRAKAAGGFITLPDGSEIEVSSTYNEHLLKTLGV